MPFSCSPGQLERPLHTIAGVSVEVKKATPQLDVASGGARGGQPPSPRSSPHAGSRLFVGGVPESIPVSSLRRHFEQWGEVKARSFRSAGTSALL